MYAIKGYREVHEIYHYRLLLALVTSRSPHFFSIYAVGPTMLANTVPGTDSSVIPHQLFQSDRSLFRERYQHYKRRL